LERRNTAGRVVYKTLEDPWTGSESDKFVLLGYLDQLRKDPALLSSEAVLPDLIDELAPVSIMVWGEGYRESSQAHRLTGPAPDFS
jgi:DnaJ family protein C protein 16